MVIDKAHVGSTEVDRVYLGPTLVYQADDTKCNVVFKTEEGCTITLTGVVIQTVTNEFMGEYEVSAVPSGVIHYQVTKTDYHDVSGSVEIPKGAKSKYFTIVMYPKKKLRNRIRTGSHTNTGSVWIRSEYVIKTEMDVTIRVQGNNATKEFIINISPDNGTTYHRKSFNVSEVGYPERVDVIALSVAGDQYYDYEVY